MEGDKDDKLEGPPENYLKIRIQLLEFSGRVIRAFACCSTKGGPSILTASQRCNGLNTPCAHIRVN